MSAECIVGICVAEEYYVVTVDETSATVIAEEGRVEGGIGGGAMRCRRHDGRRYILLCEDGRGEQRRETEDVFDRGREGGHGRGEQTMPPTEKTMESKGERRVVKRTSRSSTGRIL